MEYMTSLYIKITLMNYWLHLSATGGERSLLNFVYFYILQSIMWREGGL